MTQFTRRSFTSAVLVAVAIIIGHAAAAFLGIVAMAASAAAWALKPITHVLSLMNNKAKGKPGISPTGKPGAITTMRASAEQRQAIERAPVMTDAWRMCSST